MKTKLKLAETRGKLNRIKLNWNWNLWFAHCYIFTTESYMQGWHKKRNSDKCLSCNNSFLMSCYAVVLQSKLVRQCLEQSGEHTRRNDVFCCLCWLDFSVTHMELFYCWRCEKWNTKKGTTIAWSVLFPSHLSTLIKCCHRRRKAHFQRSRLNLMCLFSQEKTACF